jgi:hypothetical protein
MSTSISGAIAGEGHMTKRIGQINTYPCLSLFISYTGYYRIGYDLPIISNK